MPAEDRFNSKNLITGEIARKGITVTKNSGTLNITSATYAVYDAKDDSIITAESDATIDGADVYASITAGTAKGQRYVIFKWVDGSYTRKARLNFDVV
jgi:methanogenic corrinoid protein MtbC1